MNTQMKMTYKIILIAAFFLMGCSYLGYVPKSDFDRVLKISNQRDSLLTECIKYADSLEVICLKDSTISEKNK